MHQLDGDPAGDDVVGGAGRFHARDERGCDGQRRSDPLSAGVDEVPGHLGQEGVVGLDDVPEPGLYPIQIGCHARWVQEGCRVCHLRRIERGAAWPKLPVSRVGGSTGR